MLNTLIGTLTLLLAGNALGATWALIALADRWNAPWMALVIPLLLTGLLRFNQHPGGLWRALLCLLGLGVAIAQCNFIVGGALVAAHLGKPLWPWLFMIGPEMAFAVARAHLSWIDLLAYAGGSALALWLGYGRRAAAPARVRRAA
jgi:hypothetical protein